MAKTRQKTLSYRRTVWLEEDSKKRTLEDFILEAHKKLRTVKARKFKRFDGQYLKGLRHKTGGGGGCFVHIVAETPGDQASTLTIADEAKDASDVGTTPPPKGSEYMDGDLFAFVKGDDVCVCASVLRDASFAVYCQELFRAAKLDAISVKFDLQKIASADKMKIINAEGVKEIDLRASLYDATVSYIERNKDASGAIGAVAKHFKALFWSDGKPQHDNLQVGVTLRADDRMAGKVLGRKRLNAVAKDIIDDDDDDYVIVTKKNQRITKNEIYIRKKVDIDRLGKSVNRDSAWGALSEFHKTLVDSGVVGQ